MKDKKRYLLIKIQTLSSNFDSQNAKKAIYEAMLTLWGEGGTAKANLRFIDYLTNQSLAILCVNLEEVDHTICALSLKIKYNNEPIALRTIKISGTLKSFDLNFTNANRSPNILKS